MSFTITAYLSISIYIDRYKIHKNALKKEKSHAYIHTNVSQVSAQKIQKSEQSGFEYIT